MPVYSVLVIVRWLNPTNKQPSRETFCGLKIEILEQDLTFFYSLNKKVNLENLGPNWEQYRQNRNGNVLIGLPLSNSGLS